MRYLVISDIHENFNNLYHCLEFAKAEDLENGFVLGDLINPGIVHRLGKSGIHFKIVLGNNDGDKVALTKAALEYKLELYDFYWKGLVDGKKVVLVHYNELASPIAMSGVFTAVFCGHNHVFNLDLKHNKTLLFNPGELSGHMFGKATFGVWDSQKNEGEIYELVRGKVDVKQKPAASIIKQLEFS